MTREEIKHQVIRTMAGGLTCRELTEAVTDYLEGSLGFLRWVRFQWHLGICSGCRAYLRQMKQTIRTLENLPVEPISPETQAELLQRFRTWKSR